MKPGDIVETAIWLDGRETRAKRARAKQKAADFLEELCERDNVLHGPLHWSVLKPGDDHVPVVPGHIQGPDVRLLVAAADILAVKPPLPVRSFIGDLTRADLQRLREMTRRAYARHFGGRRLTDMECDDVIDAFGPEAAAEAVRAAVDGRTVH